MQTYRVPAAGRAVEIALLVGYGLLSVMFAPRAMPWLVVPAAAWCLWEVSLAPAREITLHDDGTLTLRSLVRSTSMRATDVRAAFRGWRRLGDWHGAVVLRTARGTWRLHGELAPAPYDLLAGLREHNPDLPVSL